MSATRRRGRHRRDGLTLASRGAAAVGLAGLLTALVLGAVPPQAAVAAEEQPEYSRTRTLTREHEQADGSVVEVDRREVTVTVDHTQNLRGRERVRVSWSGARPSAGRAPNPYGFEGMEQEYPVVVLQCRGIDDPSLPLDQQVRPETCWTSTFAQRYSQDSPFVAAWQHDRFATTEQRAGQGDGTTWPQDRCLYLPPSLLSQRLVPFVAANGTSYVSCNAETMAPEAAFDSALPPAEITAFTNLDGDGSVLFEVRTDTENESLGCSADVPCSLVVIPIMGISCTDNLSGCQADGRLEAGSENSDKGAVDLAVSPRLWWSPSNWNNRFAVPLTFGLPPDACDVLDDRAPVDMFGSELLSQASLQWAPAYCLRQDRFKFRHNRMSDQAGLRAVRDGVGAAAFTSDPLDDPQGVALGYAPVAVTGFAVAFTADLPSNAGEVTQVRLTPRLLAKLLTQSYPASNAGRLHDGLENNPIALNTDPEFIELNPGLSVTGTEATATVLSLSESAGTMAALTSYIAADAEAMEFIGGEPDPWGMVVNPSYKGIEVPRDEWPLLDTWLLERDTECDRQVQTPYLTLVAAPVNSLRKIAEAVLDAWPNVQTTCTRATSSSPWKFGRINRQNYGARFMLGVVALGDAERYGLRTAELRTSGTGPEAVFVAPSPSSMAAALPAASQSAPGQPFLIDRTELPPDAYPGTMIVHTAARLSGLAAVDAGHVAQFVRTATTEGQVSGSANGQLPEGFLPILQSGRTALLYESAQVVADAFEAQTGSVVTPTPTTRPTTTTPTTTPRAPSSTTPGASPTQVSGLPADEEGEEPSVLVLGSTVTEHTAVGQGAVPVALGVGLLGLIAAPALRLLSTRRRWQ